MKYLTAFNQMANEHTRTWAFSLIALNMTRGYIFVYYLNITSFGNERFPC